jgi:hypothetical protein
VFIANRFYSASDPVLDDNTGGGVSL